VLIDVVCDLCEGTFITLADWQKLVNRKPDTLRISTSRCSSARRELKPCVPENGQTIERQRTPAVKVSTH